MRGTNLNEIEKEEWNEPSDPSVEKRRHTHTQPDDHLAQTRLCSVVVIVQLFVELLFVAHTIQPFGYLYNGFETRERASMATKYQMNKKKNRRSKNMERMNGEGNLTTMKNLCFPLC